MPTGQHTSPCLRSEFADAGVQAVQVHVLHFCVDLHHEMGHTQPAWVKNRLETERNTTHY